MPKVFISNASEDKDRFVLSFAAKLRSKGIDAWIDRWEILAGDRLVDKIFNEGMKNANAFVIVVSKNSVNKPWVREELDAAMVRRIENSSRLIPLVLDDCEVPEALKHIRWIKIANTNSYESNLDEVVNAIFDRKDKPPIGDSPSNANRAVASYIPELTNADNLTFEILARNYVRSGNLRYVLDELAGELKKPNLTEKEVRESFDVLERRGIIESIRSIDGQIIPVRLKTNYFEEFLRRERPNYEQDVLEVASKIVNQGILSNLEIYSNTQVPLAVINHVIECFRDKKLLTMIKGLDGSIQIGNISPELGRMLR